MTESTESAATWPSMEFVQVQAGSYTVGLRWDEALNEQARGALRAFAEPDEIATWFSPSRTVALPEFSIARTAVNAERLLAESDEQDEDYFFSMSALCASLNRALARHGCRLPTEDELEVACGDSLFYWGNEIPDGSPWHTETTFRAHKSPNGLGLHFDGDPYRVEIVEGAFKLGDGGAAICGGYPWPVAWLALSRSYRQTGEAVEDLLPEYLEDARVRPVQL